MGSSPIFKSSKTEEPKYPFMTALQLLKDGKKITKLEWNDRNIYGVMDGGVVKLHKANGNLDNWIIAEGDFIGDDYIVVIGPN